MRPVIAGMCKFESLLDGTISIEHLALMNDALSVRNENERRMQEAFKDER